MKLGGKLIDSYRETIFSNRRIEGKNGRSATD